METCPCRSEGRGWWQHHLLTRRLRPGKQPRRPAGVAALQRHVLHPVRLDADGSVWPSCLAPGAGAQPWTAHRARRRRGKRPCGVCTSARARRLRVRRPGKCVAFARRSTRPVGYASERTGHAWVRLESVPGVPARQGIHVYPCRRAASGPGLRACHARAGGPSARRLAPSGHTGQFVRTLLSPSACFLKNTGVSASSSAHCK